MMTLPLPLTPGDCDLRNFAHMQLDVARLRDSRFASHSTGDGFRAGVLLWSASWHQVPAASVPNDIIELSQLAGYGRVTTEFEKVKVEALHGFLLCADGRWYHAVVAEKALAAWDEKLRYAFGKLTERLRKENKKRAEEGAELTPIPSLDQWKATEFPLTFQFDTRVKQPESAVIPASSAAVPPEQSSFPPEDFALSGGTISEFQRKSLLKGEGEGEGLINTPHTPQGGQARRSTKPKREAVESVEFLAFWAAYPRKVGRGAAWRRWQSLAPDAAMQVTILGALAAQRPHLDFRENGRFIPHGSTWLNESRWTDELPPVGGGVGAGAVGVERKPWEGAR